MHMRHCTVLTLLLHGINSQEAGLYGSTNVSSLSPSPAETFKLKIDDPELRADFRTFDFPVSDEAYSQFAVNDKRHLTSDTKRRLKVIRGTLRDLLRGQQNELKEMKKLDRSIQSRVKEAQRRLRQLGINI